MVKTNAPLFIKMGKKRYERWEHRFTRKVLADKKAEELRKHGFARVKKYIGISQPFYGKSEYWVYYRYLPIKYKA